MRKMVLVQIDNHLFYSRLWQLTLPIALQSFMLASVAAADALMLGRINENPQMPIFKGHQHIGKTYFVRNILPPGLTDYRLEVGPAERIDKDFIISLSETPLIIFDEISFGSNQKSDAFKYIVTSSRSMS